jgi:hypothetical protein
MEAGILNPRRSATLAIAFYPAAIVAGWAFVSTASPRIENAAMAHAVDRLAPSLTASIDATAQAPPALSRAPPAPTNAPQALLDAPQALNTKPAAAVSDVVPDTPEVAAAAELVTKSLPEMTPATEAAAAEPEQKTFVVASAGDPAQILPSDTPPPSAMVAGTAEPAPQSTMATPSRVEIVGECIVIEPCIDQYLFALYQRTPKEDTIKETEKRKVEVKRRGKMVTVTRSFTKLVDNDFTWKDPKAAERVGMSMTDYVFGGMDKSFKMRLFRLLQAAENAGLQPGITSGFRDDYRQGIASGLKAASNRSYHGGSLRGGYGHGLAADIVSVNGGTRDDRWNSSEKLWKWVDANGRQYGVGRPYLRFDPPHVGPIDGPEYVAKRGGTRTAAASPKKRKTQTEVAIPAAPKTQIIARSPGSKPSGRVAAAR